MKSTYALTGTVFFSIFLVSIICFGSEGARNTAIFASLLAGWSQFIAQDDRPVVGTVSIAAAYASIALGIVAFAIMAL